MQAQDSALNLKRVGSGISVLGRGARLGSGSCEMSCRYVARNEGFLGAKVNDRSMLVVDDRQAFPVIHLSSILDFV